MKHSVIDQLIELEEKRDGLVREAKEELVQEIILNLELLRDLGCRYTLVAEKPVKGKPDIDRKVCKICMFPTIPHHDARWHKGQDVKKPFTETELEQWGLLRKRNVCASKKEGAD